MKKVFYNKLIRDKISEKIEKKGEKYEVREIKDDQEYEQELLKKIEEEAKGLSKARSKEEFLSEYADLIVVLNSLNSFLKFSESEINDAIEKNIAKKGEFNKRHFLYWSADIDYKSNETPQGLKEGNG